MNFLVSGNDVYKHNTATEIIIVLINLIKQEKGFWNAKLLIFCHHV